MLSSASFRLLRASSDFGKAFTVPQIESIIVAAYTPKEPLVVSA